MNATLAPSPWPAVPGLLAGGSWVFGREVTLNSGAGALQWLFRRNCSITPRQLGLFYLSLCGVSLLIGGSFYLHGATFVLAFTGVELSAVGLALLVFARHAGDRETLTLSGRSLHVEQCIGSRVEHTEFAAEWLSVEPVSGQRSLVALSGRGQSVRVGRFLRPELRAAFAKELRRALRSAPAFEGPAPEIDSN